MDVIWERHPRTAEEVVSALASRQDCHEATITTLLNRLLGKGTLSDGRRYLYSPPLEREVW